MGYGNTEVILTGQQREALIQSLLGQTVDIPLKQFRGTIIGAIRRTDDNEDKLVAAPVDMRFTADAVRKATFFVEQYFNSTIQIMEE